MMWLPIALLVLMAIGLLSLIGYLVVRIVRGDRTASHLPLLMDVGVVHDGVLSCPVCSSASFTGAPPRSRGFFALALGPFVFGSLPTASRYVAECVVCTSQFQRGVSESRTTQTLAGL